jgi:hypothetical protein
MRCTNSSVLSIEELKNACGRHSRLGSGEAVAMTRDLVHSESNPFTHRLQTISLHCLAPCAVANDIIRTYPFSSADASIRSSCHFPNRQFQEVIS